MLHSRSTLHLRDVCMTYATHFCFSFRLSLIFFKASVGALVHAIVPGLCITSSSYYSERVVSLIYASGCNDGPDSRQGTPKRPKPIVIPPSL